MFLSDSSSTSADSTTRTSRGVTFNTDAKALLAGTVVQNTGTAHSPAQPRISVTETGNTRTPSKDSTARSSKGSKESSSATKKHSKESSSSTKRHSQESTTIAGPAPGRVSDRVSLLKRDPNRSSVTSTKSLQELKEKIGSKVSLRHCGTLSEAKAMTAMISNDTNDNPENEEASADAVHHASLTYGQILKARLFDISTDEETNYKRLGVQRSWPFSLVMDIWPELLKKMKVFRVDNSFQTYNSYRSLMPDDRVRYSYFNIYEQTGGESDVFVIRAFSVFNHFVQLLLLVLAAWSIIFSAYTATFSHLSHPTTFLVPAIVDAALEALYLFGVLVRMRTTVISHIWGKEYCDLDDIKKKNFHDPSFWLDLVSLVPLVLSDAAQIPRWFLFATKLGRGWRLLVPPPQAQVIFSAKLELFRMAVSIFVAGSLVGCLWRLLRSDASMWDVDREYSTSLSVGMNLILGMEQFKDSESQAEDWFLAFSVPVGATVQAVVIGTVLTILQRLAALQNEEIKFQDVNRQAMQTLRLPPSVQLRVFALVSYQRLQRNNIAMRTLSENLSSQLQWELNLCLYHEVLSQANLFKQLPPGMMWDVVMAFQDNVYLPGDFVCRYGETGDGMHFILKGMCAVFDSAMKVVFGYKGPGEYFGEVSLITDARRSAYVRAETFCTVAFFPKLSFEEILAVHPEQLEVMIHFMDNDQKEQLKSNIGSQSQGLESEHSTESSSDAEGTEDDNSDSDNGNSNSQDHEGGAEEAQQVETSPPGLVPPDPVGNDAIHFNAAKSDGATSAKSVASCATSPSSPVSPKALKGKNSRSFDTEPSVQTSRASDTDPLSPKSQASTAVKEPASPKSPGARMSIRRSLNAISVVGFFGNMKSEPVASAKSGVTSPPSLSAKSGKFSKTLRRSSTEGDTKVSAESAAKTAKINRRRSDFGKMHFGNCPSGSKEQDITTIDLNDTEEAHEEMEANMRRLTNTSGMSAVRQSVGGTASTDVLTEMRLRSALANLLQPLCTQMDQLQLVALDNEAEYIKHMKRHGKALDELSGDIVKLRADVARLPQEDRRGTTARPQELLKHATAALEDSIVVTTSSRSISPAPMNAALLNTSSGASFSISAERKPSLAPPEAEMAITRKNSSHIL